MLKWSPKEDITTYELALCMGIVIAQTVRGIGGGRDFLGDAFDKLPDGAKRHFEDLRANREEKE